MVGQLAAGWRVIDQPIERRGEPRIQPNREIRIVLIDNDIVRLGTLVDVSISGARFRLLEPFQVGRKCQLKFEGHHQHFACTVIWAGRNEMGVQFDDDEAQSTH
jgi:PilZ domain-containing protein